MAQEINATIRGKQSNVPYEKKTVVLGGNMVGERNILTQDMLLSEDTKYIIRWAFDLDAKTVIMPAGSSLEFNGGSINNGTIVLNDTPVYSSYNMLTSGSHLTVEGNPSVGTYNYTDGMPIWWNGSEWKRGTDLTEEVEQMQEDIETLQINLENFNPSHRAPIVVPVADEEDITVDESTNTYKFKDKAYAPAISSGLGRKYLRKNITQRPKSTLASGSWVSYQAGTYLYLLYWYNGTMYNCYKTGNLGLVIGAGQVAEEIANYRVDLLPDYAQENSLEYTIVNNLITITLPDETTIAGSSIHDVTVYEYWENVDDINLLTQEMVSESNTIFIIQYDFDLDEESVTIPENSVLKFNGGTIDNGTIVGNNTTMIYDKPIDDVCPAERQGTFIYNTTIVDEEDITSESGQLKFKDRPATDGMGRKILRKNIVNDVNTLTQEMMSDANTIYIIQYDFTLGENITVPANCILEFDGGSITSDTYVITLAGTTIDGNAKFNCQVSGIIKNDTIYIKWFDSYIFENINNLLASGKTFLFEKKDYTCKKSIRILYYDSITIDFNGAVIYDRIDDYEPDGSSIHTGNYRYASLIYAKGCEGLVIKNLNYKARVSDSVYQWNGNVITIGRTGDSDSFDCKNVIIENCSFYDDTDSISDKLGIIGCLGNVDNIIINNIYIADAQYTKGFNFEYGLKDTTDFGLTGRFPTNVCISNVTGKNLHKMSPLIRTGGCCNLHVENIRCVDVFRVMELYCGDEGSNSFEGMYYITNVSSKYTKAFTDTLTGNIHTINLTNVGYANGTSGVPFDTYHQIVNHFIFNNVEIHCEEIKANFIPLYISNIRGKVIFNNLVIKNGYGAGFLFTSPINDADGNPIESWGVEFNKCKIDCDRGFTILGGIIKNMIFNDVYLKGKFVLVTRSSYNTKVIANRCIFSNNTWNTLRHEQIEVFTGYNVYYEDVVSNTPDVNFIYDCIFFKCDNCITSNGTGIRKSGTFAQKPAADKLGNPIGFRYFCTDKQTTEGVTDGIEIIHKGNNVWVDALGRVVS